MSSLATNIKPFKQRLVDKERELLADMASLQGEARVSGEAEVRDSTDNATSSQGASESLQEDSLASQTLTQVHDALLRIEDSTYGKCAACGRQIDAARLNAIPWAKYCLEDQEKREGEMSGTRRVQPTLHAEEGVHESHQKPAEQHELAARAHRTAAEHNEKGDDPTGNWHSERALQYAEHAYRLARDAHNKSGQIESL
jgi:DnaK suppressor protein